MTKEELTSENERLQAELDVLKDAQGGSNVESSGAAELRSALDAANKKLKAFGIGEDIEQGVANRMALGMDRETARTCARRQAAHDQVLAKKFTGEGADTQRQEELIQAASLP